LKLCSLRGNSDALLCRADRKNRVDARNRVESQVDILRLEDIKAQLIDENLIGPRRHA
jgi:hypothetical protein